MMPTDRGFPKSEISDFGSVMFGKGLGVTYNVGWQLGLLTAV
jgi:hypothetical protein